jgi:cell division protein FtsW (lipid II flippase)
MELKEKAILRGIVAVTFLMFITLAISLSTMNKEFDFLPIIFGILSCILFLFGYFVIKQFFPSGDKLLLIIAAFITQFGLVMIYRLDRPETADQISWGNILIMLETSKAVKQILWFAIGVAVYILLVMFLPEIKKFSKYKNSYIVITIILLLLPLVFGREIKGSRNWISLGGFSLQPSEIAKLFLIFYLASVVQSVEDFKDAIKVAIPVFLAIGVLVIEKDLGASLMFFGIFMTVLYIGTSNLKYILAGISAFFIGGFISYFLFSHVRVRVSIWIDPWKDKFGKGNQIVQSLIAIGTGVREGFFFGTGLGQGHPFLIPEAQTDFIFAAICEELGLLGGFALILLYLILVYRGLRIAIYAKDDYSRLVAVGIASMIGFQVFVIIGGVTKMLPLTGITLPFVSYGGSSMLLSFASLAVLQKISEPGSDVIE